MLFSDLFKLQAVLESDIIKASGIAEDRIGNASGHDLRILALIVKTAELANLTKCYKFGALKEGIEQKKLALRYLDMMQYVLSIGNNQGFNIIDRNALASVPKNEDLPALFLETFGTMYRLNNEITKDNYVAALNAYIKLFAHVMNIGELLGLTEQVIFDYYNQYI